jgi:elongation factor Ts
VTREEVSPELLAHESEIARDRARNEGKPEKILDRIVQGRLEKFFEEVCLLEQPFIKENSTTIGELLKAKGTKLGDTLQVLRFARFKVGETAPAADAAAE